MQSDAKHYNSTPDGEGKLPITAIIPVLNCAHRIREHMEKSMEWLPEVAEIVVVDSHSKDHTLTIIKEHVSDLNVRIITHPKGLYESWNRGVKEAASPFVYFSTVGDHITLAGLKKLLGVMTDLSADVVISPPEFSYESDSIRRKTTEYKWPIHEIIQQRKIKKPILMDPWDLYDFVLIYLEQCVMGSSASNLYRRSLLSKYPFSDDFYSTGDSAWIIEHNFDARIAILPETISSYLFHIKDWANEEFHREHGPALRRKFACAAYIKVLENTPSLDPNIAVCARDMLDSKMKLPYVPGRDMGRSFSESMMRRQSPKIQNLLKKLSAICLEVEFLNLKKYELEHYRKRIGPLRHLWPPAIFLRLKRKQLGRQVRRNRKSLQAS